MSYKIIVLSPAAGGKSTLVRYLRAHTNLEIAEVDEEILKANNNVWPTREHKETVTLPQIAVDILSKDSIVYFTYRMAVNDLEQAKQKGFKIIQLDVDISELHRRNVKRMAEEGYDDISHWFEIQLKNYNELRQQGLIDQVIDGHQPTEQIANQIIALTK